MCTLFCMNICLWGSWCQSGCRVCSRWIKNDNVSLIPSAVWSCFAEINLIFCVGMWQRTKLESITTLRSQSARQWSGLQSVRSVQSGKKRKCTANAVFWDAHGVLFIDYLEKGKTINSERYIGQLMRLKNEISKKRLQMLSAALQCSAAFAQIFRERLTWNPKIKKIYNLYRFRYRVNYNQKFLLKKKQNGGLLNFSTSFLQVKLSITLLNNNICLWSFFTR